MSEMSEEDYLVKRVEEQIEWYGDKASYNQSRYKICRRIELIMAVCIPIVLLIGIDFSKIIVGIASAIIAASTGIQGIYKFHENWIEYRATSEVLKHEKFLYLIRSGIYKNINEPFYDLVERIESITSHENINWSQVHRPQVADK